MPNDPSVDDHVDVEIAECLSAELPRSFFLFAGAGSGKTRSLVTAVEHGKSARGHDLTLQGKQIAVITFTNAAADEISRRLDFDPLVRVSTIHSFSWDLIREFQEDIHEWVGANLHKTIAELESKQSKAGTKKEADRVLQLQRAHHRISTLDEIRHFTYNPAGENRGREALNHSQVINLTAHLLVTKPMLGRILVTRHPVLFIDESQDTNKTLLEAFMHVAAKHEGEFTLGLFGDTMQRIYTDGKTDIEESLPDTWVTPVKIMNHRSPERIVRLSNRIRSDVDGNHPQEARADRGDGVVRLFIASTSSNVETVESAVARQMATITQDPDWVLATDSDAHSSTHSSGSQTVKRLILEHSMAAQRLGFAQLFTSLSALDSERTSLLDGSIPGLQVFLTQVTPLMDAFLRKDKFRVARIVRENSPLMTKPVLEEASKQEGSFREILVKCQAAVDQLTGLWGANAMPTLGEVANVLEKTGLFSLTTEVRMALVGQEAAIDDENFAKEIDAWKSCLAVPFSELTRYGEYVSGASPFATHQGVKGLEFPRVMVVISDFEARGFMFSYEKLFGVKPLTPADTENRLAGKDTSSDRTRRLLYVTCSRATQSLAIVAYTLDANAVHSFVIDNDWFDADEIVLI